jgi:hypothetical protein
MPRRGKAGGIACPTEAYFTKIISKVKIARDSMNARPRTSMV